MLACLPAFNLCRGRLAEDGDAGSKLRAQMMNGFIGKS